MSGSFRLGDTMANPLHIERMRSINFRLSHDCARIEAEYGVCAWSRDQIIDYLRQPNAFGKALMNESGDVVLGYMLYRLIDKRGEINLDRILVHPDTRRAGVGSAMLQRLKERVGVDGIRRVVVLDDLSPGDDGKFCNRYEDVRALLKASGFTGRLRSPKEFEFVYEK